MKYLDFTTSNCKDCFKCLRECPVKAIKYENHRANIIESKCILCGKCTHVCPQNAKKVHSEKDSILEMIANKSTKVVASIAPSFVSTASCLYSYTPRPWARTPYFYNGDTF